MSHEAIHEARSRAGSFAVVVGVYALAVAAGAAVGWALRGEGPLVAGAAADVAGTVAIFAGSRVVDNTSMYDAYWSVAPPFLLILWGVLPGGEGLLAGDGITLRQGLLGLTLGAWAVRLTWNWARGWHGLHEEDWRYADFRRRLGPVLYWLLSFFGLHMFPTVQVFLGMLPALYAMRSPEPVGWLAGVGAAVVAGSVLLQGVADNQLRRFVASAKPDDVLRTGLWSRSRHPNYLGELGVWLGVLLLGLDAGAPLWTAVGFGSITAMFLRVSIPMMEKRQAAKRPAYRQLLDEIPMLVPRPW